LTDDLVLNCAAGLNGVSNIEGRVDCSLVWDISIGDGRLSVKGVDLVKELVLGLVSLCLELLVNGAWSFVLFNVIVTVGWDLLLNLGIGLIHVYFLFVHEVGSLSAEADWVTTVIGLTIWVWLWLFLNWLVFFFLSRWLVLASVWVGVCWILSWILAVQVLHVTTIVVVVLLLLGLSLNLLLFLLLWLEVFFTTIVEKAGFICHYFV